MIPPERYQSLGALLRDALIQYKSETLSIEWSRKKVSGELTYLEFKRKAERLARAFENRGIGAGDRVAIIMSNQPLWLITAYAILYRGGIVVPIDFKLEGDEQEALLKHAEVSLVVTEYGEWCDLEGLSEGTLEGTLGGNQITLSALVANVPARETLPNHAGALDAILDDDQPFEAPTFVPRKRSDQATLVYSSGTGGNPKGCILTHDNYLEQFLSLTKLFPFEVGDRYFSILPTNHAIDFMCGFIGTIACGATVVHQRSLRPELLRHVLQNGKITHMAIVPLLLEAFERRLDETLDERSNFERTAFRWAKEINAALTLRKPRRALSKRLMKPVLDKLGPDLRFVFCGGAFVEAARARRFFELGLPVVIGYGLTEAGTVLTVGDLKPFRADSVGRPLDGVELEIRSGDGALLMSGDIGEVWAKSRTVFAGYFKDEELTKEAIVDGWLRTGDRGYLDASGHLHLVGRNKNMIVTSGGKNIYPEDIEQNFARIDVDELVIYAKDFLWPRHGEGDAMVGEELVAVVRAKDDTPIDVNAIAEANRRLPDFKRLSGYLLWDDEFPRTASMKVKRGQLANELRARGDQEKIERLR